MAEISIRPATREDAGLILRFIRALAVYEREPEAVEATEETLIEHGFGPKPYFECMIAECDGAPAGFAFYFFDYSTWLGKPGLYLEDIFVDPEFRGRGIGRALLERLAQVALERGCARMKWEVLDWNEPAIKFYRKMGARPVDDWITYRVTGSNLAALAERFGGEGGK